MLKTWSQQQAADRAGVDRSFWSRVENGERRADRFLINEFAAALECSVTDLTGQPYVPADAALELAHAQVQRIWLALLATAPDEPASRSVQPTEALTERVADLETRGSACDLAGTGKILIDLLPDVHAAMTGPDMRVAALLMVRAAYVARGTLHGLGYPAQCVYAADRCRQVAERIDDPVALAVSDFGRAHAVAACGGYARAETLAVRAADNLERHMDAKAAPEILGMLHLTAGLSVLAERRTEDARAHLWEARRLAQRTGETTSWNLFFGPTNVGLWEMAIEVEAGEPGRASAVAMDLNPAHLPPSRTSYYYVDFARALADMEGQRDEEALRMLLTAERVAPQSVRSSPAAQATARFLLDRSRKTSPLHGLCERMAIA